MDKRTLTSGFATPGLFIEIALIPPPPPPARFLTVPRHAWRLHCYKSNRLLKKGLHCGIVLEFALSRWHEATPVRKTSRARIREHQVEGEGVFWRKTRRLTSYGTVPLTLGVKASSLLKLPRCLAKTWPHIGDCVIYVCSISDFGSSSGCTQSRTFGSILKPRIAFLSHASPSSSLQRH